MSVSKPGRKIGVFNHGGTKNLGDEALLAAVIQNSRRRAPGAEIIGFTINPEDTHQRHGIPCFPIRRMASTKPGVPAPASSATDSPQVVQKPVKRSFGQTLKNAIKTIPGVRPLVSGLWHGTKAVISIPAELKFLFDSYRRLKDVDLLLAAGGQQLNDGYGGAWGFPFTLLKWTILAKCTGTKVALLSVGAGPLELPLSKFFVKCTLGMVNYRSYRDAISSRMMESMRVKGSHPVYPDLVYSLQLPSPNPPEESNRRVVVGTNTVPFFDGRYWPTPDPARYQDYVRKVARFAEWLDKSGHAVLFFPTQVRADTLTINDIRQAMNGSGHSQNMLTGRPVNVLEDLVSEISRADLVVANRYHGILISLVLNKPVLGVAYHEKSRALLEQAGQGDYVLNIENFKVEDLVERFQAMEANAPALKKQIAERLAPLRQALDEQYDKVFRMIGIEPAAARKVN
jgi:polysaccharide pyruvyl transferase WcaK-like protein